MAEDLPDNIFFCTVFPNAHHERIVRDRGW